MALALEAPGCEASVLSALRTRLLTGQAEHVRFATLLTRLQERDLLQARGRQRTDSTPVLAAIRVLHRLTWVGETLRQALHAVAPVAPDGRQRPITPDGCARSSPRLEDSRLPSAQGDRHQVAVPMGRDGFQLLTAVQAPTAPVGLRERPAIEGWRRVWLQQYDAPAPAVRWRAAEDFPPQALLLCAPSDVDARSAPKRETPWTGETVHLTATCAEARPHRITPVATPPATPTDVERTPIMPPHLAAQGLLPREPLLETGSIAADHLVTSRLTHAVALVGLVLPDTRWPARRPEGFEGSGCAMEWEAQTVRCPQGHRRRRWTPTRDNQHGGHALIASPCAPAHCAVGPVRARCPQAKTGPRTMQLRPPPHHEALQVARQCQTTAAFQAVSAARAGVAGTLSQGTRAFLLRQTRSLGLAKTPLQHLLMALAMHLARVAAWLAEPPRAPTRLSSLAA